MNVSLMKRCTARAKALKTREGVYEQRNWMHWYLLEWRQVELNKILAKFSWTLRISVSPV